MDSVSFEYTLLVETIEHIAWPVAVVVLGWMFRSGITAAFQNLFSKSSLKEFRAGGSGITATFEAERQITAESEGGDKNRAVLLPPGQSHDELKDKQQGQSTSYSERLYQNVLSHIDALGVDDRQKIELLGKEVSLLQANIQCLDVAKVLFRSQFDLFSLMRDRGSGFKPDEIAQYFKNVAERTSELRSWDYIRYLSYPASVGLIEYREGVYQLTEFGESFIDSLRMNPRLIDDLSHM